MVKEKIITFIIEAGLDAKIERYAKKNGKLKRFVINQAIESFFNKKNTVAEL